jgi:hypothetical protein
MNSADLTWARTKLAALLSHLAHEMRAEALVALAAALRLEGMRP